MKTTATAAIVAAKLWSINMCNLIFVVISLTNVGHFNNSFTFVFTHKLQKKLE